MRILKTYICTKNKTTTQNIQNTNQVSTENIYTPIIQKQTTYIQSTKTREYVNIATLIMAKQKSNYIQNIPKQYIRKTYVYKS